MLYLVPQCKNSFQILNGWFCFHLFESVQKFLIPFLKIQQIRFFDKKETIVLIGKKIRNSRMGICENMWWVAHSFCSLVSRILFIFVFKQLSDSKLVWINSDNFYWHSIIYWNLKDVSAIFSFLYINPLMKRIYCSKDRNCLIIFAFLITILTLFLGKGSFYCVC